MAKMKIVLENGNEYEVPAEIEDILDTLINTMKLRDSVENLRGNIDSCSCCDEDESDNCVVFYDKYLDEVDPNDPNRKAIKCIDVLSEDIDEVYAYLHHLSINTKGIDDVGYYVYIKDSANGNHWESAYFVAGQKDHYKYMVESAEIAAKLTHMDE